MAEVTGVNPQASAQLNIPSSTRSVDYGFVTVTSIGNKAFYEWTLITSVTIPDSVTSIGESAFQGCSGLRSFTVSSSVTSIGSGALNGCSGLTSFTVAQGNSAFSSTNGVLFNKDKTLLLFCAGGKTGDYTIPDGVTSIAEGAFQGCSGLTSVTIPNSVTNIGKGAFLGCSGLTSVTVNKGSPAFSSNDGGLFNKDQTSLLLCPGGKTDYTVPSSVTSIGKDAFNDCSELRFALFLGDQPAFDFDAFVRSSATVCYALGNVSWHSSINGHPTGVWTPDDGSVYVRNGSAITFMGNYSIANADVIIPSTFDGLPVTSIGKNAFRNDWELTSVTIPSSIKSIGPGAFRGCWFLSWVYCWGNAPVFVNNPIDSMDPANSFGGVSWATFYYAKGKAGWGPTYAGFPTATWSPVAPPAEPVNILVVQSATSFQNPVWTSVATNTVRSVGAEQFYRMRSSVVEVTVNLKNPSWTPVATNNLPVVGSQFYRLVAP